MKYRKDCEKIFNFLINHHITHSEIISGSLDGSRYLTIDMIKDEPMYKVMEYAGLPFQKKVEIVVETTDIDQALLSLNLMYTVIKKIQENS